MASPVFVLADWFDAICACPALRKESEIGTNSDGKARIEGLPDKLKKPPLEFKIQGGDLRKSVTQDPATDCHGSFNVQLGRP